MQDKTIEVQIPSEYARLLDRDWRTMLIYGGRYSLKSHTVARALLIRAMQEKTRTLCAREQQNSLADSSHQLLSDLIEEYGWTDFLIQRDTIVNTNNGSEFIFKGLRNNTQNIKSLEGIDIAWVDEAQMISKSSIDVLTPTIRKPGSQIIWTMNRLNELDPVYAEYALKERNDCVVLELNYDVAEKYGWLPKVIKDEIEYDKINSPELYSHKWLGLPMNQVDNAIISREAVLNAMERTIDGEGQIEIGVDVARMGNDRTELVKRQGLKEIARETYTKLRTTEVVDMVMQMANGDKTILIKVDDTGVGGGVTDELKKQGYNVVPINFGSSAVDKNKYTNLISEAWFYMQTIMPEAQLLMDNELLMELSNRAWKMDTKGRRQVESKDDYKKRGYRSPDKADATILCFYTPQHPKVQWAAPIF